MTKIYIVVEGGLVQEVYAKDNDMEVVIIDNDLNEDNGSQDEIDERNNHTRELNTEYIEKGRVTKVY